MAAALHESIYF